MNVYSLESAKEKKNKTDENVKRKIHLGIEVGDPGKEKRQDVVKNAA